VLLLALPALTPSLALTHISCSEVLDCLIATAPAPRGHSNLLVHTTDGGMTGSTVASPTGQNLLAVSFTTPSGAIAVGQEGATVLSSDGDATFPMLISHSLGGITGDPGEVAPGEVLGPIKIGKSPLDAYAPGPQAEATPDRKPEFSATPSSPGGFTAPA
jgi:hypothetical protein